MHEILGVCLRDSNFRIQIKPEEVGLCLYRVPLVDLRPDKG